MKIRSTRLTSKPNHNSFHSLFLFLIMTVYTVIEYSVCGSDIPIVKLFKQEETALTYAIEQLSTNIKNNMVGEHVFTAWVQSGDEDAVAYRQANIETDPTQQYLCFEGLNDRMGDTSEEPFTSWYVCGEEVQGGERRRKKAKVAKVKVATKRMIVFPVTGPPKVVTFNDSGWDSIKAALNGGHLESHPAVCSDSHALYCDEEGILKGLPPNEYLAGRDIELMGPAVLSRVNEEGEECGVTDEDIAEWIPAKPLVGVEPNPGPSLLIVQEQILGCIRFFEDSDEGLAEAKRFTIDRAYLFDEDQCSSDVESELEIQRVVPGVDLWQCSGEVVCPAPRRHKACDTYVHGPISRDSCDNCRKKRKVDDIPAGPLVKKRNIDYVSSHEIIKPCGFQNCIHEPHSIIFSCPASQTQPRKDTPAPPLVGVETNPGPVVYVVVNLCNPIDSGHVFGTIDEAYKHAVQTLQVVIENMISDHKIVFSRGMLNSFQNGSNVNFSINTQYTDLSYVAQAIGGQIHRHLKVLVIERQYITPPAPPLVGIEPNPGPMSHFYLTLQNQQLIKIIAPAHFTIGQALLAYAPFLSLHAGSRFHLFSSSEAHLFLNIACQCIDGDEIYLEHVGYTGDQRMVQMLPPAPRLVGIEENPGPTLYGIACRYAGVSGLINSVLVTKDIHYASKSGHHFSEGSHSFHTSCDIIFNAPFSFLVGPIILPFKLYDKMIPAKPLVGIEPNPGPLSWADEPIEPFEEPDSPVVDEDDGFTVKTSKKLPKRTTHATVILFKDASDWEDLRYVGYYASVDKATRVAQREHYSWYHCYHVEENKVYDFDKRGKAAMSVASKEYVGRVKGFIPKLVGIELNPGPGLKAHYRFICEHCLQTVDILVSEVQTVTDVGAGYDYGGGFDSGRTETTVECPECSETTKFVGSVAEMMKIKRIFRFVKAVAPVTNAKKQKCEDVDCYACVQIAKYVPGRSCDACWIKAQPPAPRLVGIEPNPGPVYEWYGPRMYKELSHNNVRWTMLAGVRWLEHRFVDEYYMSDIPVTMSRPLADEVMACMRLNGYIGEINESDVNIYRPFFNIRGRIGEEVTCADCGLTIIYSRENDATLHCDCVN
jgi:hypothetical protein